MRITSSLINSGLKWYTLQNLIKCTNPNTFPMHIGLDFDGVISDCGRLKSDAAKILYEVEIPPERFKTELVVGEGILTLEQYRHLQRQIYGTRELGLLMKPVNGVLDYLPQLQQEGHQLRCITSRYEEEADIAREWLSQCNLSLPITAVGGRTKKAEACQNLEIYIDDDLDKLEPLAGIVPHLFLFSWGYNQHIDVPAGLAQRVDSWKDFYENISPLISRPFP